MNTQELATKFEALGLNQNEALILSHLAELPEVNVTDLGKRTNIPRGSIYRHLFELEQKGFIEWILDTKGKKVSLANLSALKHIIEESRKELDQKEDIFEQITQDVGTKRELSVEKPIIRHFEGKEGVKQLIWNTLDAKTEIKVYTNAFRKELFGQMWLVDYTLEFVKRNLKDKVLGDENYAKEFHQKYGSRNTYFSPVKQFAEISKERIIKSPLLKIQGEIYIYNDVVASYTWEDNTLIGNEIKSKYFSTTQSTIFDLLWSQTTEDDSLDKYL
jgi:sugar-specific transcriptional regulator TrmB